MSVFVKPVNLDNLNYSDINKNFLQLLKKMNTYKKKIEEEELKIKKKVFFYKVDKHSLFLKETVLNFVCDFLNLKNKNEKEKAFLVEQLFHFFVKDEMTLARNEIILKEILNVDYHNKISECFDFILSDLKANEIFKDFLMYLLNNNFFKIRNDPYDNNNYVFYPKDIDNKKNFDYINTLINSLSDRMYNEGVVYDISSAKNIIKGIIDLIKEEGILFSIPVITKEIELDFYGCRINIILIPNLEYSIKEVEQMFNNIGRMYVKLYEKYYPYYFFELDNNIDNNIEIHKKINKLMEERNYKISNLENKKDNIKSLYLLNNVINLL